MFSQTRRKPNKSGNHHLVWSDWAWDGTGRLWYRCANEKNGKRVYDYNTEWAPPPEPVTAQSSSSIATPRILPEANSLNTYSSQSNENTNDAYSQSGIYTHEQVRNDSGTVEGDLSNRLDRTSIAPTPAIVYSAPYETEYRGKGEAINDNSSLPSLSRPISVPTTTYGIYPTPAATDNYSSSYNEYSGSMTSDYGNYNTNQGYGSYMAQNAGNQLGYSQNSPMTSYAPHHPHESSNMSQSQPFASNANEETTQSSGPSAGLGPQRFKADRDTLDSRFKLHPSRHFKIYKVFKVLWSEPMGETSSKASMSAVTQEEREETKTKYGQNVWSKIRRFVIVRTFNGHSQCLPILTYQHQGTTKHGVKAEDHAMVYTSRERPKLLPGEAELAHKPIQVTPATPRDKLYSDSRINYAKIYTIEHNVKVVFIGEIASSSQGRLMTSFDEVSDRGQADLTE